MRVSIDLSNTHPSKAEQVLIWLAGNQVSGVRSIDLHGCPLSNISNLLIDIIKAYGHILRSINLAHCPKVDDKVIEALATHSRDLESITLFEAGKLSQNAIHSLIENCTRIRFLDVRAQQAVTDETATLMCNSLKELQQVLLVGTNITVKGFVEISNTCSSLDKIGCIQLSGESLSVPPLESSSLEELQITSCATDVRINFKKLPKLTFLGCNSVPMDLLNWNDIAQYCTDLKQIMFVSEIGYCTGFLECLRRRADQLLHLAVGQIPDTDYARVLWSMKRLIQLRVHFVSLGLLQVAAELPSLQMLTLVGFPRESLSTGNERIFGWLFSTITNPFRSLLHLHLVLASGWDAVPVLLKACPMLRHFHFHPTRAPTNLKEIIKSLPAEQMETFVLADSFSIEDIEEIVPLLVKMTKLTSLRLGRVSIPMDVATELVFSLPNLQVFESPGYEFSAWTCYESVTSGKKWLRHAPTKGFYESDALKPSGGFLTLFRDVSDPVFGVDIP